MKNALKGCGVLAVAIAAIASLAMGSTASAAVVVGQTASAANLPFSCSGPTQYDELQTSVEAGASYTVPASGAITAWSTYAPLGSGQAFTLKVFRPIGPSTYLVVAQETQPLAPGVLNTFAASIPVQAGDVLGENQPVAGSVTPCVFETGLPGDSIIYKSGNVPTGGSVVFPSSEAGFRLNVSATILPPPTITAISPVKGSIKGANVTITGTNFANVSGVAFGGAPAKSFTVVSEGQITAVSPVSTALSKVPVTVTSAAGTATSTQLFQYQGCKVPQLKGKKLKAAKKKLKKAGCKLGSVKKTGGATANTGKVSKQNPKPGKVLAPGTKVKVTLAS